MPKKRIDYFKHDKNMRNNYKIKGLRRLYGNEGYAVWCYILEALIDSDDLTIDLKELELLAQDFEVSLSYLKKIIDYCVEVHLLCQEDNIIYSKMLRDNTDILLIRQREISQSRAIAGKIGMMKRWNVDSGETNDDEFTPEKRNLMPYNEVLELWNSTCKSLPRVERLSEARKTKIRMRLAEWEAQDSINNKTLDKTKLIFEKIEASDFLTGRTDVWKASFDWLFTSANNWIKVIEGNYDNKINKTDKTIDEWTN